MSLTAEADYISVLTDVNTDANVYLRIGWLVMLLGVGGFILWALLAPLDKGVPLTGNVAKASNRQAVQHQTGGTIQKILVRDGDIVKAGQVVVRMNPTVAGAEVDITEAQAVISSAAEARLEAEHDGDKIIHFPKELSQRRGEKRIAEVLKLQDSLLLARRASLRSELGGIEESIAGLEAQISGLRESHGSKIEQVKFLKEQLLGMRDLAIEGAFSKTKCNTFPVRCRHGENLQTSDYPRTRGDHDDARRRVLHPIYC